MLAIYAAERQSKGGEVIVESFTVRARGAQR